MEEARLKVLAAALKSVLLGSSIDMNPHHMNWRIEQIAKDAGVTRELAVEVLGPILHDVVDEALKKPEEDGH